MQCAEIERAELRERLSQLYIRCLSIDAKMGKELDKRLLGDILCRGRLGAERAHEPAKLWKRGFKV